MSGESTYDLKPSKEAYQAVKADVTAVSAIEELIDNALDNWQRTSQKLDDLRIDIEYEESQDDDGSGVIIISDNSGGVPEDDVSMLFALGQSAKDQITGSIGAYGVGAKKAILNLGNKAVIKSRELHTETGFGFTIDQDWLEDEGDWTVEKEEYTDIDDGTTEIRITELNVDWEDFEDDLKEQLTQTYRFFLSDDRLTNIGDLSIYVNSDLITPPDETNWSYLPLDGFHPRRYEGIEIDSRDLSDTVYVDIEVGVLQKADSDAAGADIYCQDRQVLSAVRDTRAGFKTGRGSTRLGNFTGNHRRLKVIIEFYTEGDTRELPWDAQKSDIDEYHKVTQAALSWVRRIVKPYHEFAGDYEIFPTTFGRPYTKDHPHAHNKDLFDYSGDRERVTDKPNTSHDDCKAIIQQLKNTEPLKLRSYGDLDEKFHPAYDEELTRRLHDAVDFGVTTDEIPVVEDISDADGVDVDTVMNALRTQARRDLKTGRRFTDLPEWQQPAYDWLQKVLIDEGAVDTGEIDGPDDLEEVTEENLEDEDDEEETSLSAGVSIDELSEEDDELDTTEDDVTNGGARGEDSNLVDSESDDDATDSGGADGSLTDFEQEVTDGQDGVESLGSQTTTEDDSDGHEDMEENVHYLAIPDDEWDTMRGALNVDDDASEEEVKEALLEKLTLLKQLAA